MHCVVLASHSAEACPTSNAKTKALLLEMAPQIPAIADKHGVRILAGPFANREHTVVVITRNQVRILPSVPMEEAMRELAEAPSPFCGSPLANQIIRRRHTVQLARTSA
jgi:hypothetical protein